MRMGNIAPREGIEPTFLAFQGSVLTIKPPRLPAVTMLSTPTCIWIVWEVSADYYTHPPWNCKSFNAYDYSQTGSDHTYTYIHRVGSTTIQRNHTYHSLYRVTATSIMIEMKIGTIAPRVGTEPTSLAFWASVLTITPPRLLVVITLSRPTCIWLAWEVSAD